MHRRAERWCWRGGRLIISFCDDREAVTLSLVLRRGGSRIGYSNLCLDFPISRNAWNGMRSDIVHHEVDALDDGGLIHPIPFYGNRLTTSPRGRSLPVARV